MGPGRLSLVGASESLHGEGWRASEPSAEPKSKSVDTPSAVLPSDEAQQPPPSIGSNEKKTLNDLLVGLNAERPRKNQK